MLYLSENNCQTTIEAFISQESTSPYMSMSLCFTYHTVILESDDLFWGIE